MSPKNVLTSEKIKKLILETIIEQDEEQEDVQSEPPPPSNLEILLGALNAKEKRFINALNRFAELDNQDQIKEYLPGIRKVAKYFRENLGSIGLSAEQENTLKALITKAIDKKSSLKIPDSLIDSYSFLEAFAKKVGNNYIKDENERMNMKSNAEKAINQIEQSSEYQSIEDEGAKTLLSTTIDNAKEAIPKSEEEKGNIDRKQYKKGQIRMFKNRLLALVLTTVKATDYTFGKNESAIKEQNDYKKLNSSYERYIKEMNFEKDLDAINNRLKNSANVITPTTFVIESRKNINTLANFIDIFFDCANLETQMGKDDGSIKVLEIFTTTAATTQIDPTARINQIDDIIGTINAIKREPSNATANMNSLKANAKAGELLRVALPSQVLTILRSYIKNPNTAEQTKKQLEAIKKAIQKTGGLNRDRKIIKSFNKTKFTELEPSQIIDRIFFDTSEQN